MSNTNWLTQLSKLRRERALSKLNEETKTDTYEPPRKRMRLHCSEENDSNIPCMETSNDNEFDTDQPKENEAETNSSDQKAKEHTTNDIESENPIEIMEDQKEQSPEYPIFGGKDPMKLQVSELKVLCKSLGLKVGGKKHELIHRLKNPMEDASQKYSKRISRKQVHDMLHNAGVEDPWRVNDCLKRAIQQGIYKLDGPESLDTVIWSGKCLACETELVATIRQSLYQPNGGYDYCTKDCKGAIKCTKKDCCTFYISRLCEGKPIIDLGKGHKHCTGCPGFGRCIYDIRNSCRRHVSGSWWF